MQTAAEFFEEHMGYILRGERNKMIEETFWPDAVLYHNFPFFPGDPPYTARGHKEIIETEDIIFAPENQGAVTVGEPFNLITEGNFIGHQIFVTSPNTGKWVITDVFVLRDGKVQTYYAMGYVIEPPKS